MPDGSSRPQPTRSALQGHDPDIAAEALAGLRGAVKTLPPKLFYDAEGCRLFGLITELPEYYVTRTELALLRAVAPVVAARVTRGAALVEYGASHESKAELLLGARDGPFAAYVPIDVAGAALAEMVARLAERRPALAVLPVAGDFLRPLDLPRDIAGRPLLGFFPGSTIGNLDPAGARDFLVLARETLGRGALFLVGVDLRKDPGLLVPAYDDAAGVTAAFNLNMLARLNRDAGADFDLADFRHKAVWNDEQSRIEMHLVSRRTHTVTVAGEPVRFLAGETIHTESSYKHTPDGFARLAASAGWSRIAVWTDPRQLFSLHLLSAEQV
jgi:dimethylhistidine N-methyltransferase